jgi:heme A synthase
VLSIFPIVDVASWLEFSLKIVAVLVGANVIGLALYAAAGRKKAGGEGLGASG